LGFNGTFSTIRLYRAFGSYSLVYVLENGNTLGVLYISYSVADDQRHKHPLVSHCFLFTMALTGMEPAPNPQRRGGSIQLEGGSFKFVTPAPKHEGK